jgi:hypothetical protein
MTKRREPCEPLDCFTFCEKHPGKFYPTTDTTTSNVSKSKICQICSPCFYCNQLFTKSKIESHETEKCILAPIDTNTQPKRITITVSFKDPFLKQMTELIVRSLRFYLKDTLFSTFFDVCSLQEESEQRTIFAPSETELHLIHKIQKQINRSLVSLCTQPNYQQKEHSANQHWRKTAGLTEYSMIFICLISNLHQCLKIALTMKYHNNINLQKRRHIMIVHDPDLTVNVPGQIGDVFIFRTNLKTAFMSNISYVFELLTANMVYPQFIMDPSFDVSKYN